MAMTTRLMFLALAAALPAQGIALLEGGSPANLSLRVLDEGNVTAPGTIVLQQIEIVPIEITGRTVAQELQTARARRIARNGLYRVELPGGGRLFQYRRQGGAFWGYLLVPPGGLAHSVLELPGAAANASPFADRIGVAADGQHAVVPLQNGDSYVVRLDGGTFASTGTPARLVTVANGMLPTSVMVGRSHVFFATGTDQVMRCALADGGTPVDCSAPPQPNGRLKDLMAMAGDGSCVAFLYGPRDQWQIFLLRETGGPLLLPPTPSKYEEPNYLPEGNGQPTLLLDDHADRLFYIDAIVRDESYLLDVHGVLPTLHVTDDPVFQPYIGIHILPSFAAHTLYVAIGDANRMDWFAADLTAAGGTVTNLTGTGSLLQPFPSGTLDPAQMAMAGGKLLTTEAAGQGFALRQVDPAAAQSQVLYGDLLAPPTAGSSFTGAADLLVQGQGGDRLFTGGQLLAATPPAIALTPPNHGPLFSATWVQLGGGLGIAAFYLANGMVLPGPVDSNVSQLVMTAAGGCFWNGPTLRYFAPGVLRTLTLPPQNVRLCISGAGG